MRKESGLEFILMDKIRIQLSRHFHFPTLVLSRSGSRVSKVTSISALQQAPLVDRYLLFTFHSDINHIIILETVNPFSNKSHAILQLLINV